jgi:hypothetical protein
MVIPYKGLGASAIQTSKLNLKASDIPKKSS